MTASLLLGLALGLCGAVIICAVAWSFGYWRGYWRGHRDHERIASLSRRMSDDSSARRAVDSEPTENLPEGWSYLS